MKTFREKYDFWIDRQVGKFIYRYGDFAIKRCRADDAARHFMVFEDFETQVECGQAWRKLCDQSAGEKENA